MVINLFAYLAQMLQFKCFKLYRKLTDKVDSFCQLLPLYLSDGRDLSGVQILELLVGGRYNVFFHLKAH